MESTECYVGHERTGFTFCQICAKPSIGGNNIEGVRECKLFNGSILDAMNRKHVVLDVPSDILFDFGYVYIHEDEVLESQAKAQAHHHWHFIKEGCDMLKSWANVVQHTIPI